jgi:hypothetical protein
MSTFKCPPSPRVLAKENLHLSDYFITGFTDGEGCFLLSICKNNKLKTGWAVSPEFTIHLQGRDIQLLSLILTLYFCLILSLHYFSSILSTLYIIGSIIIDIIDEMFLINTVSLLTVAHYQVGKPCYGQNFKTRSLSNIAYSSALNPQFITGFLDAEGCFMIKIGQNSKLRTGWTVSLCCSIGVHLKDRLLLEKIMAALGVGQIYKQGKDSLQLRVESLKDIDKLIKFLDKYPLISQK